MKRIMCLLLCLCLLCGCGTAPNGSNLTVPTSSNETTEFSFETWSEDPVRSATFICATASEDGELWVLDTEQMVSNYSPELELIQQFQITVELCSLSFFDGVLYGIATDDPNTILKLTGDGLLEDVCTFTSEDQNNLYIYNLCACTEGFLLRLNDTSLRLVDQQGNVISSITEIRSASIWNSPKGLMALEYDFENAKNTLFSIVSSSDIKSKTIDLPEDYFMYHGISIDQQTYIYGENCVLKMDGSDMIPVCDFYLSGNLLCMIPQEDHIAAVTDCGLYRLTPSDNTTTAEVTTLTLGTMFRGYVQDEYIKSAIKAFNAAHSDVEIVAVDYMDGHATVAEATTALNLDIAAGCGPDLIDTVAFDYDTYIRNGTLISLDDRIQQDIDAEYFHPNLLSSLTLYGSVYAIMAGYQLDALSVHGEYLEMIGDNFTWSISGFSDQIDQAPENVCVLNCDPGTFLSLWCNNCIEDYIQNNTCNFDSDSFVQLLKTANKLSQTDAYDLYALNHVYIHSVQDYLLYLEINNRITGEFTNYSYIGFPSDNSNGVAFEQKIAIGISVQSKDPDLCWAFIKSLLEEDFQKQISVNMFSIRTDVLNNCILDAKSDDGRQFTDSQTEYFHELMDGIDHIYGVYPDVTAIVLEEASAYFTGDKTAEQVAQIVQNRVTIYLGEHY